MAGTGDILAQEEIGRWTAQRTLGLIERLLSACRDVVCLLASALASRVS